MVSTSSSWRTAIGLLALMLMLMLGAEASLLWSKGGRPGPRLGLLVALPFGNLFVRGVAMPEGWRMAEVGFAIKGSVPLTRRQWRDL